jgi:hypothetical protein
MALAVKVGDVNGSQQHQEQLWKTAIGEVISSLSRYVDTMALLRPSHWRVSSGRSGTEAILTPAHYCVLKLFKPLSECFYPPRVGASI